MSDLHHPQQQHQEMGGGNQSDHGMGMMMMLGPEVGAKRVQRQFSTPIPSTNQALPLPRYVTHSVNDSDITHLSLL